MATFAVAAGHDVTADAAAETLRAGGTAVDAAISGALAALVAEPVLAGLLGGGFLMVREPSGRAHLLDFFVQTPKRRVPENDLDFRAIEADFGTTTQEFHIGAGTIATPGVAPGLAEAHARFGRVPMRELAEPACTAGRQGLRVTAYQARLLRIVGAIYSASPGARALFCDGPDAEALLLAEGATYRNPALADVLEEYAHEGPRFVTEGEVAQALLSLAEQGGHLTGADLAGYSPAWRTPLTVRRAGARIAINPPPALGGALVAFGLEVLPRDPGPAAVLAALAATTRARVEAALDGDATEGAARLLDPALLARYRDEIRHRAAAPHGTTHISVIDGDGMGAALTLSNGTGGGLIVPGTGIMPNNMLGEADLQPRGFHRWPTDTRMASMMAPLAIDWPDGRTAMLGSGGSNRIRTALVQVLVGLLDRGLDPVAAIEAPRLHVEAARDGAPDTVDFEDVGGEAHRDAILAAAPESTAWSERSMFYGGVHAAMAAPRGGRRAAGDPRRAGVVRVG